MSRIELHGDIRIDTIEGIIGIGEWEAGTLDYIIRNNLKAEDTGSLHDKEYKNVHIIIWQDDTSTGREGDRI